MKLRLSRALSTPSPAVLFPSLSHLKSTWGGGCSSEGPFIGKITTLHRVALLMFPSASGAVIGGFLMTVQGYSLERQQHKLTRHFGVTIHSEFCLPPRQRHGLVSLVVDHIILVLSKINFVSRFWSPRDKPLCLLDFLDFKLLSPVTISLPLFYPCFLPPISLCLVYFRTAFLHKLYLSDVPNSSPPPPYRLHDCLLRLSMISVFEISV